MRLIPFALLALALTLAGCAGDDASESNDPGQGGQEARELSGNVTVQEPDAQTRETAPNSETPGNSSSQG